jgi:hypothetical protein
MSEYKIPGVYIEEKSVFPPSVSATETAVPVFLGYTRKEVAKPQKIGSMMEFESIFGLPPQEAGPFVTFPDGIAAGNVSLDWADAKGYHLYYCVEHYFKNGGGPCYIISAGVPSATTPASVDDYLACLDKLRKLDEPTLIVLSEPMLTLDNGSGSYAERNSQYFVLLQAALQQCGNLMDRFVIADMPDAGNDVMHGAEVFRSQITESASYCASYYPHLETALNHRAVFRYANVIWVESTADAGYSNLVATATGSPITNNKLPLIRYEGPLTPQVVVDCQVANPVEASFSIEQTETSITLKLFVHCVEEGVTPEQKYNPIEIFEAFNRLENKMGFSMQEALGATTSNQYQATSFRSSQSLVQSSTDGDPAVLQQDYPSVYGRILNQISKQGLKLPSASAMAGIYASVDRERGVWKAPANVALAATKAPTAMLSQDEQAYLDVDPETGKSINCILKFTGKGILPWGARTMDAANLDWRYISVRRLFMVVEEALKNAARFAVFEPNDKTTWSKVKAMVVNYLYSLWQEGALQGSKPDEAFFVQVGLGETMTFQDVLDGRMIVQIGMAPVHPAEFIILRFSQMQQNA